MQQRHLVFLDIPCPHEAVWAQLDNEQQDDVIDVLARLLAQTARPDDQKEEHSDD